MSTYLKTLSTTAGFLEHCPIEFDRGLNCIIGSRGTCKSTSLESARFVFETDPTHIATQEGNKERGDQRLSMFGVIKATLGFGSVECRLEKVGEAGETEQLTLQREIGQETRIFVNGVQEHIKKDVLRKIEVFSQGDLQRVTEDGNESHRLALLDRPNQDQVAKLREERETLTAELVQAGNDLRLARRRLSTLDQEVRVLSSTEAQLETIKRNAPAPSPELEVESQSHSKRQRILDGLKKIISLQDALSQYADKAGHLEGIRNATKSLCEMAESDELKAKLHPVQDIWGKASNILDQLFEIQSASVAPLLVQLSREFEESSKRYYELRQEQQNVNESIRQVELLERQVSQLNLLKTQINEVKVEELALLGNREQLMNRLREIDDELFQLRKKEVDAINIEHGETVMLTLHRTKDVHAYAEKLNTLLSGSRIRSQDEIAKELATEFSPQDLIDIVESGEGDHLANVMNRDPGQIMRIIMHLQDHQDFYELEKEEQGNSLQITFYDNGQAKNISELSKGQRATALLPIILRPLPYPLLFDQPEDDLDNRFVFHSLIATIRKLKTERQLIFITHNANIPVLGEADKVIVMGMQTPTKASPALTGNVDIRKKEILNLLEGGAEAFRRREDSYGTLLDKTPY